MHGHSHFTFLFLMATLFIYSAQTEPYTLTLFDDFDSTAINSTMWQVATWSEHGGQTGKERCFVKDGFCNMVFINDSQDGFLSAAMQTRDEFLYGRWEARLKPSSVPGVLNSMYTIDWNNTADNSSASNGTKQEIDIEFLTFAFGNDTGSVHYAVHAAGKESFQTNPDVPLSFNPSDDFHVWGFEITPEKIEWFVDSTILQTYVYSGNDVAITSPYQLKFNVWSAEKWINGPPQTDVETVYLIDWIRFTPHTSPVTYKPSVTSRTAPSVTITRTVRNLQIRCARNTLASSTRCFLYTLNGLLIYPIKQRYTAHESVFTYSVASLPAGCYCYKVQSDVYLITGKMVINNFRIENF